MTIQKEEGALTERAVPGPALFYTAVTPEQPRAYVGFLHGYADHGARYAHVMQAWAERGIATVALDMRGHGRAEGTRGHCTRFDEYKDDAAELARMVRDRAAGAACFLCGHSFGGLVAASTVLGAPATYRGVLLSAPYFGLGMEVPAAKIALGKLASRIFPKLALPAGIKGTDLTHDPAQAVAYEGDPLVFKKATARWFVEATRAQALALARARELSLPLYVVFGAEDHVAKPAAGKAFFDRAGSPDKTWDERKGLFHEVLHEPEGGAIAGTMAEWMLKRA